jgi:hypothetical protein
VNKVSLPDGAWAVLRDPEEVTERRRRPLIRLQRRALAKAGPHLAGVDLDAITPEQALEKLAPMLAGDDFDALEEIDDLVIEVLVDSWSFDLPVTADGSLDLPPSARAALVKECKPLLGRLLGDTADEDVLDPASPPVPANDSDRP